MPSRICGTIDCGRVHFAKGYCERCYRKRLRKQRQAVDLKNAPASDLRTSQDAGNPPSNFAEFPGSAGGSTGVQRQSISAAPLLSAEGVASSHLLAFVRVLAGTGTRTAPSVEFGGFRWR